MPAKATVLPPSKEQIALAAEIQQKINTWLSENRWCVKSKLWIVVGLSSTTIARIEKGYISRKTASILENYFKNSNKPAWAGAL